MKWVYKKWRSFAICMALFFAIVFSIINNSTQKTAIGAIRMKQKSVACMHADGNDMRDVQQSLVTLLKSASHVICEKKERKRRLYEHMCGAKRGFSSSPGLYACSMQKFSFPNVAVVSEQRRYKHALVKSVMQEKLTRRNVSMRRQNQINGLQKLLNFPDLSS